VNSLPHSLDPGRPATGRLTAALGDIIEGVVQWRRVWVLSWNEVQQRYRRSRLGQLWITLSMALTICGIGTVFAGLLSQPFSEYIPFLGAGLIAWTYLSINITDLSVSCVSSEAYLKSYPGPRSIVVYRVIVRNLIIFAHNLLIMLAIWLILGPALNFNMLLFFPGLVLIILNFGWLGLILGPLSARFRDVPQVLTSLMQLLFFITPVIYSSDKMAPHLASLSYFNPFANAIEVLRAPLLGQIPPMGHYINLCVIMFVGYGIALPFYARFRARIVYWL
jgi:ABC-type polysaccharide/polyol phosphate export permease